MLLAALLSPGAVAAQPGEQGADGIGRLNLKPFSVTCPRDGDEIVVCGRRRKSPYRLPLWDQPFDPKGSVESVSRERNKLLEGELGGLGSCTNSGPGGMTGCLEKAVQRKRQQEGK